MIKIIKDFSLINNNSFGIEAKADFFVEYSSETDLINFLKSQSTKNINYFNLGGGCNVLFIADYKGYILNSQIKGIEIISKGSNEVILKVGSGETWDDFVLYCVDNFFQGAENLSLIPGSVGASAVQNIGAYGVEAKDIIYAVDTINSKGKKKQYLNAECNFSYRHSIFKETPSYFNTPVITYVYFKLRINSNTYNLEYGNLKEALIHSEKELNLKNIREAIIEMREKKLPDYHTIGNAGSFFKNPIISKEKFNSLIAEYPNMPHYNAANNHIKLSAGWLIEQCGWKGKTQNNAGVYKLQALVLINATGRASGKDILSLSNAIQKDVYNKFGVNIDKEIVVVENPL
ncbi:MAG: UDP-N-acetylmuramate dehydrogenase [Bacteroidales bacterium]